MRYHPMYIFRSYYFFVVHEVIKRDEVSWYRFGVTILNISPNTPSYGVAHIHGHIKSYGDPGIRTNTGAGDTVLEKHT